MFQEFVFVVFYIYNNNNNNRLEKMQKWMLYENVIINLVGIYVSLIVLRRAFNMKRWKDFCIECNKIPYTNCKLSPIQPTHSSKHKAWKPANWPSKSYKFLRNLRDIKERFKEEARVIENCLSSSTTTTTTTIASSRQEPSLVNPSENLFRSNTLSKTRKESPIFDPSDYIFQGYPHLRNPINGKPKDCWYFHKENTQKCKQGRGMSDSPIFENRTYKGRMFKSKSTCVRS
ncbi:hypothetical protein EZV62_015233 [Acer yangbiense]|uniref:Uncharacterized protein n=1 Tax=Acer yangbiense TaxID=1000413 RepID=A0A5C7HUR9_9ROSI|nr:hypothetical protein EZV62_015233 [Acer yangbiense]